METSERSPWATWLLLAAAGVVGYVLTSRRPTRGRRRGRGGYRRNPKEVTRLYLKAADDDLRAAEILAKHKHRLALFHVQQAAEKVVKALLREHGLSTQGGHSIGRLARRIPPGSPVRIFLPEMTHLEKYATDYRYPDEEKMVLRSGEPFDALAKRADHVRALIELIEEKY